MALTYAELKAQLAEAVSQAIDAGMTSVEVLDTVARAIFHPEDDTLADAWTEHGEPLPGTYEARWDDRTSSYGIGMDGS